LFDRRPPKAPENPLSRLAIPLAPWIALGVLALLWPRRAPPAQPGLSVQAPAGTPETFDAAEPGRGRLAPRPDHIPAKGWKDILWRTFREIGADKLPSVAGGVTFYALLALFPALGAFVSLYGLVADVNAVRDQLLGMAVVLPPSVVSILGDQMLRLASRPEGSLGFAFVTSLILSVWSANAGMKALFNGLNVAYDETEKRGFVRLTLLTYGFTLCGLLFLTITTGLLVALPIAFRFVGLGDAEPVWLALRWVILLAVAGAAFCIVYRYAPARSRARWRWVLPGGVFAAAFWLAGSFGFSFYVQNFAHYDATYGSLGAVIGFMMWIWFSIMVVLIGAELNAEIEHQTARDSTTGLEKPIGARGAAMADTVGLAFHFHLREILRRGQGDAQRKAEAVQKPVRRPQAPNSSSSAASRAA
jgi:membrane protein